MVKKIFMWLIAANVVVGAIAWQIDLLPIPPAFAQDEKLKGQEQLKLELIQDIRDKQKELKAKEEELARKEERLQSLGTDLEGKIAELKRVQVKIDELIQLRDDLEDSNVATLSKTYGSMGAEEAADRLARMDRRIALKILSGMKSKQASRILETMEPTTATEMTEQLVKRTP